ncbi:ATP-binding protein [Pacificispira sp.]|uniref:ATP-binding protein n=1 Tax=Pacificispira sp. TaxID=2888761 RepID=UPI003BAB99D3
MSLNIPFILLFAISLLGAALYAYRQACNRSIVIEAVVVLALAILLAAQILRYVAAGSGDPSDLKLIQDILSFLGAAIAVTSIGYLLFKSQGRDRIVEDLISTRAELADRRTKSETFRRTLRRFVSIAEEEREDFDEVVLEIAADALKVDRASIWIGAPQSRQVECVASFDRMRRGDGVGMILGEDDFPAYFEGLSGDHVLAVSNCWDDVRTKDFRQGYLPATGVTALCDVELDLQDGGRGIICFETVGTERIWVPEDISFIHAVGDLLLLVYARQKIERATRELHERDARFRDFSRAASDFFWECDAELKYTFLSDRDSQVSTDGGVIGLPIQDSPGFDPNNEGCRTRLDRMKAREPFRDLAVRGWKHDGSETIVAVSGIPIFGEDGTFVGYRGTGRDILEKYREEMVQRAIQATVSGGIGEAFLADAVNALVEFGNKTAWIARVSRSNAMTVEILAGANAEGPLERSSYSVDGAPCAEVLGGKMVLHTSGVANMFPRDTFLRECGIESYGGVPLRDEKGRVIGMLVVMMDRPVRDPELMRSLLSVFSVRAAAELNRIRAEEERTELQQQLLHSQRLETMGALAGGMAHDFNNVLTPILGYSEMLMEDFEPGTQSHEDAEAIFRGAQRARRMVEQILAFSRRGDTDASIPFNIDTLIRGSVKFMSASIPASIEMSVDIVPDIPMLVGDPGKFDQVLMNLITNAYHAIGDREGRIDIRASKTHISDDFARINPPLSPGDAIRVDVSDTGCGIEPDVLGKIFEPYFTTKGSGRGTGFGLSTCRGIVDALHGTILVDSKVDRGSTFTVLIPADTGLHAAETHPTPEPLPTASEIRHYSVVYVDDEVENNVMAIRLLERAGHKVRSFDDPERALAYLEGGPGDVDVLITDDSMPKLQGWELAAQYRKLNPDGPVVVVSGGSGAAVQARYAGIDAAKFVQKPFVISELIDRIDEAAKGREKA